MVEFSEEEIQSALNYAVIGVFLNDKALLDDKCSERAISHWFANYFWCYIHGTATDKEKYQQYIVDTEYNRVEFNGRSKSLSSCKGERCGYSSKCTKYVLENIINGNSDSNRTHRIMIDMIYHQRGHNDISSNIFCAELKTTSTSESDYKLICDQERISALVFGKEQIKYQFGATVFFSSSTTAKIRFCSRKNTYHPCTYILKNDGSIQEWDGIQ